MSDKLTAEFLKRFGSLTQLKAIMDLKEANYNPEINKLEKEINHEDLEGDLQDFLKSDLSKAFKEGDLEKLFKIIDADGNGKIDTSEAAELSQAGSAHGVIDDSDFRALFGTVKELNGDAETPVSTSKERTLTTRDGKIAGIVSKKDLPEGATVSSDGKIYDKNFNEIGVTRELLRDTNGDGKPETITAYYLYHVNTSNSDPNPSVTYQVTKEELPYDFYTINNKILDKDGFQVGRIVETISDVNNDGKPETITTYLLYEKPQENGNRPLTSQEDNINRDVVTTNDGRKAYIIGYNELPQGYSISNNGNLYDKDFNLIGVSRTYNKDINGDGIAETVTSYYCFGKQQEESEYTGDKYQIKENEIPYNAYIIDNKIYDASGFEIGRITEENINNEDTGKTSVVKRYYLYTKPAEKAENTEGNTQNNIETTGNLQEVVPQIVTEIDENGNTITTTTQTTTLGNTTTTVTEEKVTTPEGETTTTNTTVETTTNGNTTTSVTVEAVTVGNVTTTTTTRTESVTDGNTTNTNTITTVEITDTNENSGSNENSGNDENQRSNENTGNNTDQNNQNQIVPKEFNKTTVTLINGMKAYAINIEDLPAGAQVSDGEKIYDANYKEIGITRTEEKDIDGDGIMETVTSYYLYKEAPEVEISESDLPEGYQIINGKICDKNFYPIGYVKYFDEIVNGEPVTITKYYLNRESEYIIEDEPVYTGERIQIKNDELPFLSYIIGNKIYNTNGFEIGIIEEKEFFDTTTNTLMTEKKYFLYQ